MMLSCIFLALCGPQDPIDARKLYREGQYAEAAKAFGEQAAADPDSAETQYNLGVSLWRTGDLRGAEAAAERYAALPGGGNWSTKDLESDVNVLGCVCVAVLVIAFGSNGGREPNGCPPSSCSSRRGGGRACPRSR